MNPSLKDVLRWISVGLMYLVSTIGLSAGLSTALSLTVAATTDGFTLNKGVAGLIGVLLGLIIQWMETDHVLHPDESDDFENWFIPFLIFIDATMLFIALGGHLNIIWMVSNYTDLPGMIVHIVGLLGQIVGAVIGSYGAEKQLAKVMRIKPSPKPAHSESAGPHNEPSHSEPAPTPASPAAPKKRIVTVYAKDDHGQSKKGFVWVIGRGWASMEDVPPEVELDIQPGPPPPPPPAPTTVH